MSSNLQTSNPIYHYGLGELSRSLARSEKQGANHFRHKMGYSYIEFTDSRHNEHTRSNINLNTDNYFGTYPVHQETHEREDILHKILKIVGYVCIFMYYGLHCVLFGLVILNTVVVICELKGNSQHWAGLTIAIKFLGVVALPYLTYYLKTPAAYYRRIYYREGPEGSFLLHWLKAAISTFLFIAMGICTAFLIFFGFAT